MTHRLLKCLALVLLVAPFTLGANTPATRSNVYKQIDLLVDVRHEIVSQYVEEPDQPKMVQMAVRAMVESLNDPYTVYISPEELAPFDKQIRGTFSGIGAEVDVFENHLRIISPLDDSPAWKAGVLAGDIVLEIDGASTLNLKINDAIQKLMGPEGTPVKLKIRHLTGEEKEITINRGRINVQTVKGIRRKADSHWDFMLDPSAKIGYIRLTQFTEKSIEDFRAALKTIEEQGVKGLILDLRFDPGGLLETACAVSDAFLEKGQRIVSVKGRVVPERVTLATDGPKFPNVPLVVIANEASASASEVVTGALSDNNRALFVGTRTFGKGSVQQVMALDNDEGAIKITNAYYYLPNGRNIHKREGSEVWGVDPSEGCYVPMNAEQVRKMAEVRRDADVLRAWATKPEASAVTPDAIE
ncbi:MAG: S41 family peptidase [Planctomycetota bacterium]|nr:S41 family peptidase [Planctomycetota bacterium]